MVHAMDDARGLELIEELKENTEKFRKEGRAYQLLQEYFDGLSKETLRDLLCCENKRIKQLALWIVTELGKTAKDLLEDVVAQMNDSDPYVCYYSSKIVACYGTDKYMDDFMRIFSFFEHPNAEIRVLSMFVVSDLSDFQTKKAYDYLINNRVLDDSHKRGLLALINANILTTSEVIAMINDSDSIIRKYGIIAAAKVYKKHPEIIKESVNSKDFDVQDFSRREERGQAAVAQWRRDHEKRYSR